MKKKHILVVSQYFHPETIRVNDVCKDWVKRGYKVTVVTGIPNYPQGKFYKGYSWLKKRKENWEGIDIIRVPIFARGKTKIGLVLNYFSFVFFGRFWKTFTRLKPDQVFVFGISPMTQALVGVEFAKRRKIPCYLHVQDLWPENVIAVTGVRSKLVIRPIEKMMRKIYKKSTKIFVTSPSMVEAIKKYTNDYEKIAYWPQYAEEYYLPVDKRESLEGLGDNFKIIFTGNIGTAQGLDVLVDAAVCLKDRKINDVSFVIVGDGRYKEELLSKISNNDVEDAFIFTGRKPAEEIPSFLGACDAAFLSFADDELWNSYIPAKLQSYMACAMPIIASASGESERIIKEADCGYVCEKGNGQALADIIIEAKNDMALSQKGLNARNYCVQHFDKKTLMDEMDKYFETN